MGQPNEITQQMITHMLESGILFEDSGVLGLGPEGERLFGAKNFMALMSVFETPLLFQVICGTDELGWVHPFSFAKFRQQSVIISLGGRAWEVIHIDRERSVAHVAPVDALGRSRWLGESTPLGHRLCRAVRDVLAEEEIDPLWSRRAVSEITAARIETTVARSKATVVSSDSGEDQAVWWTFGGLNANASIAEMIKHCGGSVRRFDNYSLEFQGSSTFQTHAAILDSIRPSQTEEVSAAAISPTRVKFWECVPSILQWRFIKARFSDAEQASQILSEPRVYSVKTSR
jgi:ATP-dependent Lhr-like helicase